MAVGYTPTVTRGDAHPGWFITIEGPDGSGKTEQAARLRERAALAGVPFVLAREPGGTDAGERIRDVLFGAGEVSARLDRRTDALLFNASRAQLVSEVIQPGLEAGSLVLATRYADSTVAYQGYGSGLPIEDLRVIERFTTGGLVPDLTLLLDLAPEVGLARKAAGDHNKFETHFDLAFHARVRAGYRAMATAEPERFVTIDADRAAADVFVDLVAAIARTPRTASLGELLADPAGGGGREGRPASEPVAADSRIP